MLKRALKYIEGINSKEQWLLYLAVNCLFIYKYLSRTSINVLAGICSYAVFIFLTILIIPRLQKLNQFLSKYLSASLVFLTITAICFFLYKIEPLSINVDRWSATTYFLDGLFSGVYPYGIHTHVCETNYPSPFPLWQYINIPFWLVGDVGIGLIIFFIIFAVGCYWFTNSFTQTFIILLLLTLSPSYWWEVLVRSDGLSNTILVFISILMMEKKKISFQNHWVLTAIICGLLASTRLSAIIPLAIYLCWSFFKISFKQQLSVIVIILSIVFIFFSPYIFWNTDTWIFFSRNPFMSQTSTGNIWILLVMVTIAIVLSLTFKNFRQYTRRTACFIFIFFGISLIYNHLTYNADISFMEDADFDISYLSLALPYCLFSIANTKENA